jgi:hypothetical protein
MHSLVHQNIQKRFFDLEREKRRFQSFSELYFQQRSAFQYVCQQQNYRFSKFSFKYLIFLTTQNPLLRHPYEALPIFPPSSSNILRPVARRPTWTASTPQQIQQQHHHNHQHHHHSANNNFECPVKNPILFTS